MYHMHCKSESSSSMHPFPEAQQQTRHRPTLVPFITKSAKVARVSVPVIRLDSHVDMSVSSFARFLAISQNRGSVDLHEAAATIANYDAFVGKNDTSYITLKGFTHYLLSQELSPPPHLQSKEAQNMDQPLSSYLIASSHNTYLTGYQLHGESSVSMYIKVRFCAHSEQSLHIPPCVTGATCRLQMY
jgi:hypothetical protein